MIMTLCQLSIPVHIAFFVKHIYFGPRHSLNSYRRSYRWVHYTLWEELDGEADFTMCGELSFSQQRSLKYSTVLFSNICLYLISSKRFIMSVTLLSPSKL